MSEDWESGHFLVVKQELPRAVVVASSVPLTEVELDRMVSPYGEMLAIEQLDSTVGYAYRVTIEAHPDVLARCGASRT